MSYLVLSRKHRPQDFDSVLGQDHITDLLKRAIKNDRTAHAYLFCGPRGVGKTSCARILAKSLNCEKGPTIHPCGECSVCKEITRGSSFDVLEIDGASNRGIDEIRDLRENVKFAPSYGRYKIYIVDEVHMLTTEAFNALLKTLEEPPEHVKFIFATTAAQKVPGTIISRCQKFDFKRISVNQIALALEDICKKEKFKIEKNAVFAIAKAAQGSLRDGLSILDQVSALSDRSIKTEDVCNMLGLVELDLLFALADALSVKDCASALKILEDIMEGGKDIQQLMKDLIEHYRNLMVIKVGGKAMGKLVDYPIAVKDRYLQQTKSLTLKDILDGIDSFIEAQESARVTESVRMSLEIAFAKLTYTGEDAGMKSVVPGKKEENFKFSPASTLKNNKGHIDISGKTPELKNSEEQTADKGQLDGGMENPEEKLKDTAQEDSVVSVSLGPPGVLAAGDADMKMVRKIWDKLTYAISRKKMSVATFLQSGFPVSLSEGKLVIGFARNCSFQKEYLESDENLKLVESVFSEKLQCRIVIEYVIVENAQPKEEEEVIKNLLETFEGEVVNRWHEE